jgi:hypothetical protein
LKADLEPLKDACSSQQVETNAQFLGETYLRGKPVCPYLDLQFVQINRDEASISNLQIDPIPGVVIESNAISNLGTEYGIDRS